MTQLRPTETECQRTIIDAARKMGYLVHHSRPARNEKGWSTPIEGDPGFPDLVIVGWDLVYIVELKRKPNTVAPEQRAWLERLEALHYAVDQAECAFDASVWWVPEQMDMLISDLRTHRERMLPQHRKTHP